MILANIYVDGDTAPGLYQFIGIPSHGDRLHIDMDGDALVVAVERVDHYPVPAKLGAANIFGSTKPAITIYCHPVEQGRGI